MGGIRVQAKSPVGQDSMNKIILEAGEDESTMRKLGFHEKIENDEPLSIYIEARKKLARSFPKNHIVALVEKNMASLGCVRELDYEIEVVR